MLAFGPLHLFEKKINDAHQYNAFMCPLHAQSMHNKTQLFFFCNTKMCLVITRHTSWSSNWVVMEKKAKSIVYNKDPLLI